MSDYNETVEERDGYRVRLELDDSADKPYDDGATPILQLGGGYYGDGSATAFNTAAAGYEDVFNALGERAHTLKQQRELFARHISIFYGATKVQFWNEGISNEYGYVAFDTADWREKVGATPERLKDEDYLSEVRAWAEGEVYGHIVERNESEDGEDWQPVDDGTCWGFYGSEYAEQAARQALTNAIEWDKAHPKPVPVVAPAECVPERPTLKDEAERLLSYWEAHGDKPEIVEKWAITDMLGILRYILEDEA